MNDLPPLDRRQPLSVEDIQALILEDAAARDSVTLEAQPPLPPTAPMPAGQGRLARLPLIRAFWRLAWSVLRFGRHVQLLPKRATTLEISQRAMQANLVELTTTIQNLQRDIQVIVDRDTEYRARLDRFSDLSQFVAAIELFKSEHGWTERNSALARRFSQAFRDAEARVQRAEELAAQSKRELIDQQRRLSVLLEEIRRRPAQPISGKEMALAENVQDHLLNSLYLAFEDRFRGTRAEIRDRQCVHLDVMREANAGTPDAPILDIGTGRGEWLELLREEGLVARGIDMNSSMVALCRDMGLDCIEGDAIAHMASLPANTLGAVTGFHIAEHLPFRILVALMDEALRALRPGGVLLLETPNPANILVGSNNFYMDPTHRNPLPSAMLAMVAEARGYGRVEIRELHPTGQKFVAEDMRLAEQLNRYFFGPQDYALLARKIV